MRRYGGANKKEVKENDAELRPSVEMLRYEAAWRITKESFTPDVRSAFVGVLRLALKGRLNLIEK